MFLTHAFSLVCYALTFVVMISALVAVHEFGHYLFARIFKMGVEEFAIGFGRKPILTYMRRSYQVALDPETHASLYEKPIGETVSIASASSILEGGGADRKAQIVETPQGKALEETTDFTVRPYPLGGFVRIKGMLPEEDGSEVHVPGGFYSKAAWKRYLVLLAGPAFSILAGIALLIPLSMFVGVSRPSHAPVVTKPPNIGSPAERAGLQVGDRFISVDGQPVNTFFEVVKRVRVSGGREMHFVLERGGKQFARNMSPVVQPVPSDVTDEDGVPTGEKMRIALLGLPIPTEHVKLSFGQAVADSFMYPVRLVENLATAAKKPAQMGEQVGGPVSIVKMTASAVDDGVSTVVYLAAILSISVGVFNLLPISPLDGGQMLVAFAEMFRSGKRLSMRVQSLIGAVGVATLGILVITVLILDFSRLPGNQEKTKPTFQQKPQPVPTRR